MRPTMVLATGVGTVASTIIRPPEAAAVGACRRSPIRPRRDQPDSALYRETWRAVGWEWRGAASAVVPWEASTVVMGGFHGGGGGGFHGGGGGRR